MGASTDSTRGIPFQVTLGLDADGGDPHPRTGERVAKRAYDGAMRFLDAYQDVRLHVAGHPERLEELVVRFKEHPRVAFFPTTAWFEPDGTCRGGEPQDTAFVQLLHQMQREQVHGLCTAASNKAVVYYVTTDVRKVSCIHRMPIIAALPTYNGRGLHALDVGAKVDSTGKDLYQFAIMGAIYCREVEGIARPRIGFISNGREDNKGNRAIQEAIRLLKGEPDIELLGNIEAEHCLNAEADLAVADGLIGNVAIKFEKGGAELVKRALERRLAYPWYKVHKWIGLALIGSDLKAAKQDINPSQYSGAAFLGHRGNGEIVKMHGDSPADAFYYALGRLYRAVTAGVSRKIGVALESRNWNHGDAS